jgi:hypothetical protein
MGMTHNAEPFDNLAGNRAWYEHEATSQIRWLRAGGRLEELANNTLADVHFAIFALDLQEGDTVVNLNCGWGRHAMALGNYGLNVIGLDASADMLQLARETSQQAGIAVRWVHGDLSSNFATICSTGPTARPMRSTCSISSTPSSSGTDGSFSARRTGAQSRPPRNRAWRQPLKGKRSIAPSLTRRAGAPPFRPSSSAGTAPSASTGAATGPPPPSRWLPSSSRPSSTSKGSSTTLTISRTIRINPGSSGSPRRPSSPPL